MKAVKSTNIVKNLRRKYGARMRCWRIKIPPKSLISLMLAAITFLAFNTNSAQALPPVSSERSYHGFGYEWEDNGLGLTDEVPLPWTEIQLEDNRLRCWGREYILGEGVLPRQIMSQGRELFQRPPVVHLKINLEDAIEGPGKTVFPLITGNRVELKTAWANKEYRVEASSSLEYDGLYRIDLHIFPQEKISVDELVLTFPFHKNKALSFSRYFTYDYESQLFDRKEIVQSIGRIDRPISFQFNPAVWIGNHYVGMEWVCETNAGWSNSDPSRAIQIMPGKDAVMLQVKVVSKAVNISNPFVLSFALYPTPVKKLPDNWRQYLLLPAKMSVAGMGLDSYNLFGLGFGFSTRYPGLPVMEPSHAKGRGAGEKTHKEQDQATLKRMNEEGVGFIPYGALYGMPAHLPGNEWKDYAPLWKSMHPKGDIRNPGWAELQNISGKKPSLITICPYHRSFQDFIVWQHVQAIKKYNTAGLYLDLSTPSFLCQNPNHPHGEFVARGGEYYPFFSQRELMKRLYVACKSRNRDFMIIQHQAKNLVICSGFSDMVLSGEALNRFFTKSRPLSRIFNKNIFNEDPSAYVPDYRLLSDAFFEFQYSQNKGYVHTLLPQVVKWNEKLMRKNPDLLAKYSKSLFARAVLYDIPLYFSRVDMKHYRAILRAKQRAGVLADTTYLGPWESNKFLATGSGKLRASCYLSKEGKRILLVLANLSDHRVQENLALNMEGLRSAGIMLPKTFQVMDAIDSKAFPADQGRLTVNLEPNGFHMLIIQ